ncbi:MAG TPA: PilZ domain-containing protein [Pyrinomonadaceae bacterium]
MATLIQHLATRLRAWVGNRRRAGRHEAELEAQVSARLLVGISLPDAQEKPLASRPPMQLIGSTRNISETGLAIVVPSLRVGSSLITEENCALRIMLDIYPAGLVEMDAIAVHHRRFGEKEKEVGYLVGVRVTGMSEDDRLRYLEYLRSLDGRGALSGDGQPGRTRLLFLSVMRRLALHS